MTAPTGRELVVQLLDLTPERRRAFIEGLGPTRALLRVGDERLGGRLAAIIEALDRLEAVADDPLDADVFTVVRLLDEAMG